MSATPGIEGALPEGPVAVDTAVFIYLVERDETFLSLIRPLFKAAARGERPLVTSALTLLDGLVVPLRAGDAALAARYEALLSRSAGLRLQELDRAVLRAAAQLRATHGVRTPDALQLGAGLVAGCTSFLTNDRRLPDLPRMPVFQLRDYL